ncbi:MAG: outer membrane beta-barrel protein [Pseudomonadota bacterium]
MAGNGLIGGLLAAAVFLGAAGAAHSETSVSAYLGYNFTGDSDVDYDFNAGAGPQSDRFSFEGESFGEPPYYGFRVTHWLEKRESIGISAEFTHAKVVAEAHPDFDTFEFTNGLNFVMLNGQYRFQNISRFTPYVGVGVGVSLPYVEVVDTAMTTSTFESQLAGVAAQGFVGLDVDLIGPVSGFVEYKRTYSAIDAELNGGGSLETDLWVNQILFGATVTIF